MRTRTHMITLTAVLAILLSVLGTGLAAAAAPAGDSPYNALSPAGDSMSLDAGQSHWYAFQYGGGESPIRAQLWGSNAMFSVWTQSQVESWARGDSVEPVGRGADEEFVDGDLSWSGSFNVAGTYYVRVEQAGAAVSNYVLKVSGSEVSYPMTTSSQTAVTSDTTTETAAPAETTVQTNAGTGPADALTIDGVVRTLDAGESHWYSFRSYGADSQITIQMNVSPASGATFSIWTAEQIRLWALGEEVEPVGRGTSSDLTVSGPAWTGSFQIAGDYYVRVENNSVGISHYDLEIQ